jgi:voltage-gated potassium channel
LAEPTRARFVFSAALLTAIVVGGGTVFWLLVGDTYSFFDSIYFALITVSTVGYSELPRMELHPPARIVVMTLIVTGVGAVAFFQSALTAVLVEGVVGRALRRRRMEKRIAKMTSHTIVAGGGRTGRFVINELHINRLPFVVVDKDPEALARVNAEYGGELAHVVGDATDDHVLTAAGVERASGLVTALAEDPENVFVTISARSLNPRVRIVAKAVTLGSEAKLARAGANATVSPHRIGALRLVTELLRPHTAEFLDSMMRGTGEEQLRFDDVKVHKGSEYEGRSLREAPVREHANVLIVAIRGPDGKFVYNPPADQRLESGSYVVVLGTREGVQRLRAMVGDPG